MPLWGAWEDGGGGGGGWAEFFLTLQESRACHSGSGRLLLTRKWEG